MPRHDWTDVERSRIPLAAIESKGDERTFLEILSRDLGCPVSRQMVDGQLRPRGLEMVGPMLSRIRLSAGPAEASSPRLIPDAVYEEKLARLGRELRDAKSRQLSDEIVKREIIGLHRLKPEIPQWTLAPRATARRAPGVPTGLFSDLHFNERVDPAQIEGANEFNVEIAEDRIRRWVDHTIELCMEHMVRPEYPGFVLALGGDNYSGDIHEELTATNETQWGVAFMRLQGLMLWSLGQLANTFGRLHVVAVPGNHGRMTKKPIAKGYNYTNLDWLLYQELRLHTQDDDRITWLVPDGTDASYRIYGHRYLLTHGAQFRGGDGIIGPLGPITRGDNRKRARNVALGSEYDTLVLGHFHRLMMLPNLIVNGSGKGYDEYAYQGNFPYERPQQALWMTHPQHGITVSFPVFVDRAPPPRSKAWLEVPAAVTRAGGRGAGSTAHMRSTR